MKIEVVKVNNVEIAVVSSEKLLIKDTQSALDFIATVKYETECNNIVLNKEAISENFFILSSCMAGEILQKFINYGVRFAVYGDFLKYTSKSLRAFMYESNKGNNFYFQPTRSLAINKISGIIVRKYMPQDCGEIIRLFYNTVHTVNAKDYSKDQLDVWATKQIDFEKWDKSLREHYSLVSIHNGIIVGFGDVDYTGYIDRLYVHHDYQGKGIGTEICNKLEENISGSLSVHASITARPFFEKRGYVVVEELQTIKGGIALINYLMTKNSES